MVSNTSKSEKKNTILVRTKYGDFSFSQTSWKALRPYYPDIVSAIIEVVIENEINVSIVSKNNKDGFVAPDAYWKKHLRSRRYYKLEHTRFFTSKLKEKEKFVKSISIFNNNAKVNWLEDDNYHILGDYLYGICFYLIENLIAIKNSTQKTLSLN